MNEVHYKVRIRSGGRLVASVDNYALYPNRITFLFGESGIGKSIISKAIYGLLDPDRLDVEINGMPYFEHINSSCTKAIQKNSFFVFQEPSTHLNPLMKITDQLNEGSLVGGTGNDDIMRSLWQTSDSKAVNRIIDIFPKPNRPSGGEKQRVLLAMAFKKIDLLIDSAEISPKTFLVFDEPTGSLDNNYRNIFLDLLFKKYLKKPFTVMIITHDYSIVNAIQEKHGYIMEQVRLKEFVRQKNNTVEMRDFLAEDYFNWLHGKKFVDVSRERTHDDIVLNVEPQFKVFNRSLSIYKDAAHTKPENMKIHKGEMVYLKAPSGKGKTTLAKIVMGLTRAQKINFVLDGIHINESTDKKIWQREIWGKKAGMVFQHADEALDLQCTVEKIFSGLPEKKLTPEAVKHELSYLFEEELSAGKFLNKKISYLSGGQKQRLNLLRVLILNTPLVILDEPLNGLDLISIMKIVKILDEKRKQGCAVLIISHNEEIFNSIVDENHSYYLV